MADYSASLLLLREADVVRLCGLVAAAQALDLVRAERVSQGSRSGTRLSARVRDDAGDECRSWLESASDALPAVFSWGCSCPAGHARAAGSGATLACVHIAALITAWVRRPTAFESAPSPARPPAQHAPPARARPAPAARAERSPQPSPHTRPPRAATLSEQLNVLSPRLLEAARRTVLVDSNLVYADDAILRVALFEALTDTTRLTSICARLDDSALVLLRGLYFNGGSLTEAALVGVAERAGLTPAAQVLARHSLRACCLLFPVGDDADPAGWIIPREVLSQLDLDLGLPPSGGTSVASASERNSSDDASEHTPALSALRALCSTLTLLARSPLQLRPQGVSPVRASRPPAPSADLPAGPDDVTTGALETWARAAITAVHTARFAYRLLRALQERAGDGHPALALPSLPPPEWPAALQSATLAWLESRTHHELADLAAASSGVRVRCDPRHAAFSLGALRAENAAARARAARLLAHVRPGTWHTLDDFVARVWMFDPAFLRGRQRAFDMPAWWIEDRGTGRLLRPDHKAEWLRAEGAYLRGLLTGPLRHLGLVALDANATSFCTTEWTAYLLGVVDEVPTSATQLARDWSPAIRPAGSANLLVQPLALAPTGSSALDEWAAISGVRAGRLVWRLAADRFCANLDAHRDPLSLLEWLSALDARDGTQSAPHVAAVIERWRREYGSSRLQRGFVVVEAHDEPTLREALAALPALAAEARMLAPGVAALPSRYVAPLRQALTAHGYLV